MTAQLAMKTRALLTAARLVGLLVLSGAVVSSTALEGTESIPRPRPVAAGAAHSLAIDSDGAVWAWGQNLTGQLGTGDQLPRRIPARVTGLTGVFVAVSAGTGHSLALREDGAVFAWGLNLEGQLGIGNHVTKLTPVPITSLTNVVAIAAGGGHSLAVKADGSVWAFGGNLLGQIGDGSTVSRKTPVLVTTVADIVAVEAGLTHSLALRDDGKVFAWGGNLGGQLGDGTLTTRRRPVEVLNVSGAVSIAAGAAHSLAATTTGALWAWGANLTSQLGDGTTTGRRTPVLLSGIPPIAAVSAGGAHSVAVTTSGTALGWGDNSSGQVGNGTTTRQSRPVAVLQPPSSIIAIAAGAAHTVAFAAGEISVWSWGNNLLSQLGDGTFTPRTAPSPISGPNVTWGAYPPIFSPPGGTFAGDVSVSLSTPTPNAVIRYSLDGSDPTSGHPTFSAPIQITGTTTIKARAFRTGLTPSLVSAATYTIGGAGGGGLAMPVATSTGDVFTQTRTVTLTADAGAEIRYTLNGSDPSASSVLFEGPITIAATTTLKARAFKAGETPSEILTVRYLIEATPPGETPPPAPETVAPPLPGAVLTSFADGASFLFSGANPVQRGGDVTQIVHERFAIIRGRVLMRNGDPLAGARVRALDQAAVGYTISRTDGAFDLAVNGGGPVRLEYTRDGFLPAQRSVDAPWQDFATAPDVRLVPLDPVATDVSFEPRSIAAAARGSVMTDANGSRQATIIVPETGVMATIHLPDGTIMPGVSRLSIRATEYTVGAAGPESMPAPLPATSGYTYAVELTADEALQAGATTVTFDPPLPLYLENFLDIPVGFAVPVGSYDRGTSAWIPSDDGRVVRVLGVNAAGEAELDVDGYGNANPAVDEVCVPDPDDEDLCERPRPESLADLGITSGERKRLALLYAPGQTLWRAAIPHFSPHDLNFPSGPPSDSEDPNLKKNPNQGANSNLPNGCKSGGSIIECQNQALGELLPIAGTPFALAYRSDRVPGHAATRTFTFPVTNAVVPPSLERVDVTIKVAGQVHTSTFPPTPGQMTSFTWDGLDVYGRPVNGRQTAIVTVSHIYDRVYYAGVPPPDASRSFGLTPPPTALALTDRSRSEIPRKQGLAFQVEARREGMAPVGGWYVSAHHRYDPRARVLFMGDGDQRPASAIGDVIETLAGGGVTEVESTPVPAREAGFPTSVRGIAVAGDGSIYFTSFGRVIRYANGTVTPLVTMPGVGSGGSGVDFNPRPAARGDLVVYAYGDVQGDCGEGGSISTLRVRQLSPAGPGEELAAIPVEGVGCGEKRLAISTDGTIYLGAGSELWAIRPGTAPVVTDTIETGIGQLAAGPDGSLYIATNGQVYQWRPDGSRKHIAGNGDFGHLGDGGPAIDAALGFVGAMAADHDGNLLLATDDFQTTRLRLVRPDGTIEWYAGGDVNLGATTDEGAAGRMAFLWGVIGLAVAPDGGVILSNNWFNLLMRLRLPFDATRVPSSDGASVYEFDLSGRHLRTVDALTGVSLLTFAYDTAGRLIGITDRDGLETRIVRDAAGVAQKVVSPFGVETTLAIGASRYLDSVTDAEGRITTLGYGGGGLLTSLRDANGGVYSFDYDAIGRLLRDEDPAGGSQALSRVDAPSGWTVTHSVADGGTTTYVTEQGASGTQTRRIVAPDGTETVSLNRGDGSTVITSSDGTETTVTMAPDPRFGLAAPVAGATTIRTPAGLTMNMATARSVTLSEPNNPLSVVAQTETTTVNGRVSRSVFDATTRTITSTSPANRQVVTTLDAFGRPASVQVGSELLPTTFSYDPQGRLATQTQGVRTTTFEYDARGFLASVTDPLSRTVRFTNDLTGRRTLQRFPDLREAGFGYDANGNLTSLTPPGRPAHAMAYTPANLLDTYTAPNIGAPATTQYQFNLAKQPTRVTRADGQPITWLYDAAGRPETLTTPTGVTTYGYHAITGQLTSLTSPAGGLAYSYDGGLQTAETASGFTVGSVSWNYDSSFRVTSERVNGVSPITFTYDADSLLTSAGGLTYTRRADDGLLLTATLGDAATTFAYSDFGELASEETNFGGAPLYRGVYTRDNGGRLSQRMEEIGGTTSTDAYGYDLAGRLTAVTRDGAPLASYTYDANGNRTSITTAAGTIAATYDNQDRILTFGDRTYTHTAHGEVRSWADAGGTTTLTYDVQGNLLAVNLPTGMTVEYVVDGRNRRIGRKVNGTVTHRWLYQGQLRPVAELDATGNVDSRFVYGVRAVAPEYMVRGGVTYRLVTDQLGSVRLVVDTAGGTIVQRLDYGPWGQVITDTNPGFQPFGFAGGIGDSATRLVRFGVRDYAPEMGRWLSKDPIGFKSGNSNLYSYVNGDPVNGVDPSGLIAVHPLDIADWAAFGEDAWRLIDCPSWANLGWAALAGLGLLPGVTGLGWIDDAMDAVATSRAVIGKLDDIAASRLRPGEHTLLKHMEGDLGSPKANWERNSSVLRTEMNKGNPIRDASVDPSTGSVVNDTGFLRAERNLLQNHGWGYNPSTTLWSPPRR